MNIRLAVTFLVVGNLTTHAFNQDYTLPTKYGPLSKIIINEERKSLYIGGKNTLLHFDLDLRLKKQDIIGPVNDSKQCRPFDDSCINIRFRTVNNHISILKSFQNSLIVCGTVHQGICYMYNASDINLKNNFNENNRKNYLGSEISSVMLVTKAKDGTDIFFIGQSYDDRNADYFYNEFATLDTSNYRNNWNFWMYRSFTHFSVCDTKRENFKLKFLHIFEAENYIFHVFIRSINDSGSISYETRISKLCREKTDYGSYEEMSISCKTPSKYDIGIAAHYEVGRRNLYMTFGVRAYNVDNIQADNTQGSVVCVYPIDEMIRKFVSEVLEKCFKGIPTWGTPSWQCNIKACTADFMIQFGRRVTSCTRYSMKTGIEARGDGFSKTAVFHITNELLTSVLPMRSSSAYIILAGSNTGFLIKILVTSTRGTSYAKFDVSGDRNIPVANEMVLDTHSNIYLLTGNRVSKLSMMSCKMHQTCGECVTSHDPLRCGWCFDHCSTRTKCQHNMWHTYTCPPFVRCISPANGPLEGSTKLTIKGENFGSIADNATVSIGSETCLIIHLNDTRITCLTSRVALYVNAAVKVRVTDSTSKSYRRYGISAQRDILFEYTQSRIKKIFPMKGPLSGNTMLTIIGDNLAIGSNLSVKIGRTQCDIRTQTDAEIVCLTLPCETCVKAFEGKNLEMIQFRYIVEIVVAIDGAAYQSLKYMTFCYMRNPEIIQPPSRNSTMMSGGLRIKIYGNWFDSVTNHSIMISVGDVHIDSSCRMKYSGSMLICLLSDLKNDLNKSAEFIVGRMTVLLDNNPVKSFTIMIYPDPELDYLDNHTKNIAMADKLLELKGRYLNSAARKEDYRIEINGSRCPVLDVQQTFLICDLSKTVFKKDVPLLVSVSVGANWKTVLGHIKICNVNNRQNQLKNTVVGIALGISAVLILGLIFVKRRHHLGGFRKKISVMYLNNQEDRNMIGPQNETGNSPAQVTSSYDQIDSTPWVFVEDATLNPNPRFDAFEIADILKQHNIFIDRNLVRLRQDVGQGNSVCVHKGYLSSMENRGKQLVAVKTVLNSGKQDINALLDEAMIMKDFDHPNVLSLLGISVAPGKFPLIIIPFLANGNLLSYIQRNDNVQSCKDLMTFGLDVAMGMEYLCSLKFVHRDLAARNCMVDDNLQVKIANFGLARDVYTQNVYSSDNKKTLPVKWMAPESLKNGIYSTQSDVWSFGVVVWELLARGSVPYSDINDFDMCNYLQSGERLNKTDFCPPQLYDLMLRCWESDPNDRPTFQEINQRITGLVEQRLNNVK